MSNLNTDHRARIQARLDAANAEMDRLTASNPGTAWRWSIPAKPDRDSDLVLSAPLADMRTLLAHIDAQADAIQRVWNIVGGFTEEECLGANECCAEPLASKVRRALDGGTK